MFTRRLSTSSQIYLLHYYKVMNWILEFILFILFINYTTNDKYDTRETLALPDFRKKVEEISTENTFYKHENKNDESGSNLVSIMVKNAKELFNPSELPSLYEKRESELTDYTAMPRTNKTINLDEKIENYAETIVEIGSKDLFGDIYVNVSTILDKFIEKIKYSERIWPDSNTVKYTKPRINVKSHFSKAEIKRHTGKDTKRLPKYFSNFNSSYTGKVTCITCDNILLDDCNSPANKLVPSTVCQRTDDICFSQHTPFGLVRRGCYNINRNLTIYACSCNLCNSLPLTEMPYVFSTKKEWKQNIIEMSRTKRFRKTIFKDMSCLSCEVNSTSKIENTESSDNCLKGNAGKLPSQECTENEICGIKSIKSKEYIWRGCISNPLYNYWWTFCDRDLCNYDSTVFIDG